MKSFARLSRLLKSTRWTYFLESTATGLQLSLTIIAPDPSLHFQTKTPCFDCGSEFKPFSQKETELLLAGFKDTPEGGGGY